MTLFPFAAIVGQQPLKDALMMAAIEPSIGGVLALGDRGTGKSTAIRALAELLPTIDVIKGCRFNCAPGARNGMCEACAKPGRESGAC